MKPYRITRISVRFYETNCTKDGWVNLLWCIFEKVAKKNKIEVTGPKKAKFWHFFRVIFQKTMFFHSCDLSFNFFLHFSKKCAREYRPFRFICLSWILCSSNFLGGTSPRWCSWGSPVGMLKMSKSRRKQGKTGYL